MKKFAALIFVLAIKFNSAESKLCVANVHVDSEFLGQNEANQSFLPFEWTCPQSEDLDHSECCNIKNELTERKCCPSSIRRFYEIDNTLAIIIASSVIIGCIVIVIVVIVCCFWSKCLLYNACKVRYTYVDVVALDKSGGPSIAMPSEPKDNQSNHFFVQCRKLNEEEAV